jgi:hypothetical protein
VLDDDEVQEGEVVEGLPVVGEGGGDVQEQPAPAPLVPVPAVQAAALAATGFVAGAATVAVVSAARSRRAVKKRKKAGPLGEIVSSNSFLVDIHLLRRG